MANLNHDGSLLTECKHCGAQYDPATMSHRCRFGVVVEGLEARIGALEDELRELKESMQFMRGVVRGMDTRFERLEETR